MSKPLHDHTIALRMRAVIDARVQKHIAKLRPEDRYAIVQTLDYTNRKAIVQFHNGTNLVTVPFPPHCQPTQIGQLVRISGGRSNRYISALMSTPAWAAPAFAGTWVDYGVTGAAAGYCRDAGGRVRLRGAIKSGTAGTTAFTLPSGYRPTGTRTFPVVFGTNSVGRIDVNSDGTVVPNSAAGNTYISLDGIIFETY